MGERESEWEGAARKVRSRFPNEVKENSIPNTHASGVDLLSNSSGNPYFRFPQVTRPFDTPTVGGETPEEHPLESIARLFSLSAKIKEAAGDIPVVGNLFKSRARSDERSELLIFLTPRIMDNVGSTLRY